MNRRKLIRRIALCVVLGLVTTWVVGWQFALIGPTRASSGGVSTFTVPRGSVNYAVTREWWSLVVGAQTGRTPADESPILPMHARPPGAPGAENAPGQSGAGVGQTGSVVTRASAGTRLARRTLMSKYDPLQAWLGDREREAFTVAFVAVESVLGFDLPYTARHHRQWWSNGTHGHPQAAAWVGAGWRVASVDPEAQKVRFEPHSAGHVMVAPGPARKAA